MRVRVTGPAGTTIVTTDRQGIYEVSGVAPGDYTLQLLDLPETMKAAEMPLDSMTLTSLKIVKVDFNVEWKQNRKPVETKP